jgi:hypothetical protein
MKYSLRSLMIVVTLACVVLGGRIEYLRRWAVLHEREAMRSAKIIEQKHHIPVDLIKTFYDPSGPFQSKLGDRVGHFLPTGESYEAKIDQSFLDYDRHRKLAAAYRAAAYRPWSTIAEPTARPRNPARFSTRAQLLVTAIVALTLGLWVDHRVQKGRLLKSKK